MSKVSPMTMTRFLLYSTFIVIGLAGSVWAADSVGYSDTPIIPGTKWHVHDGERPQPPVITPGATFSHMAPPPSDAVVLFGGKDLSKWKRSEGGDARWKIENGYMEVAPDAGSIQT